MSANPTKTDEGGFVGYIEELKRQLALETRELAERKQATASSAADYTGKNGRFRLLEEYFSKFYTTNELAKKVISAIENGAGLTREARCKAELNSRAVAFLAAQTECVARAILALHKLAADLKSKVGEMNPKLPGDDPIVALLDKIVTAVEEALAEALKTIQKIIAALESGIQISECAGQVVGSGEELHASLTKGCSTRRAKPFPRDPNASDGSEYFAKTNKEKTEAESAAETARGDLNRAKKAEAEAKSTKEAREVAIKAAEAAGKC